MQIIKVLGFGLVLSAGALMSGCATISEGDCLEGNWAERGLKDGGNGLSRTRLDKYVDKCSKFSAIVDRTAYLREYERGLLSYCVYDNGYNNGRSGSSYNSVCKGALAPDYSAGYDDGRDVYLIKDGHDRLIGDYDETLEAILDVREALEIPEINDKERRRLEKKLLRLQDKRRGLRLDIREYEREYDLPRYDFD